MMELPRNERVVVWVARRGDERSAPVSHHAESLQGLLAQRREETQPVVWVLEVGDLCFCNATL
jgi:hypothetical protein